MLTTVSNVNILERNYEFSITQNVTQKTTEQSSLKFLKKYVKLEQVTPIIETCTKLFGEAPKNPVLLIGGRGTSQIIKFEAKDTAYVCRVTDATRPSFFIDPKSEIHNMWAVNDLNPSVAPKLHHADLQSGVIIMDYIQPKRIKSDELEDEQSSKLIYSELGKKIKTLHNASKFSDESTNIFKDLEQTLTMAKIDRAPTIALDVLKQVRKLETVLNEHQVSVPSHKDLHSNNVIYDGKSIYFIDWELGANCDRFVDLACASIFFVFDSKKDDLLLESYFGQKPTKEQKAQLFLMKQVCLCFYGIRLLRRVTGIGNLDLSKEQMDPTTLPKFRDFILSKYNCCSESFTTEELKVFPFMFMNEAKKNIDSQEFQDSIKVLVRNSDQLSISEK